MRSFSMKLIWLMVFMVSAVPLAMGATITGTVKGPGGAPFEGAFVEAQNTATNIMTDVLSQADGSYEVPNLPAGTYRVTIRAAGYRAAPQSETLQTADQHASSDFALEKGIVTWSDISDWQAKQLLPNSPGKTALLTNCTGCHDFQGRMSSRQLNFQGWLGLVNYMRLDVARAGEAPNGKGLPPRMSDQRADLIANYLSQIFGLNPTIPASPADLPGYPATVTKFSNQAMNIVWVVYPLQGSPYQVPFQMYPPTVQKGFYSDGHIWTADFGNGNRIIRINPVTGKNTTYPVPTTMKGSTYPCMAEAIHAIEVDAYGNAWFAESGCNRIGTVNLKTGKVTQYQAPYVSRAVHIAGGYQHDAHPMLVGGKLYVFTSGQPPYRLNPRTGKFTLIPGMGKINTYDVYGDPVNGNVWFTNIYDNMPLYEVNPKTLKVVMKFHPPTDPEDFRSHRIAVSRKGIVWLTCRNPKFSQNTERVCSVNPKTKAFHQYTPLGPDKHDYAIGVDGSGNVWYSLTFMDQIQRLDPKTGNMTQYPFPYGGITMRKFWTDSKGRVWWASNNNAAVGYFYLAGGDMRAAK
ncbi:MAG TPA: carboxypeptidase regulatory-like domain-containing protein [Patescibacteria group bacterium]|nr:carboxypeptidase regulatory-like domain-containing protein [Patescibacteria group bacterium]